MAQKDYIFLSEFSFKDTAGSLEKLRAERLILRNKQLVIMKASQLVEALNTASPEDSSTAKYSFRVVEEFPPMTRILADQRHGIPIRGIRKLHSISFVNGGLKSRAVSCLVCLEQAVICQNCSDASYTVTPVRVAALLAENNQDLSDSDSEDAFAIEEEEELREEEESDDSLSDSEESGSEDEYEEVIEEGMTVWAPFGDRHYPALVVSLSAVPTYLQRQMRSSKSDMMNVRWIGERDENGNPIERYSSLNKTKLKRLGEESSDLIMAKKCPLEYMEALNQSQCP